MSIIQDALKRREEEEKKGVRLRVEEPPPPPEGPPPAERKKPPPWRMLALALLLVLLGLGVVFALIKMGLRDSKGQPDGTHQEQAVVPVDMPPIAEEPNDVSEVAAASPNDDSDDPITEREQTSEDEPVALIEPVADEPTPAPESDAPEPVLESELDSEKEDGPAEKAAPELTVEPDAEAPVPAPPARVVEWPRVHVSGIMAPRNGVRGSVLIESHLLSVGDSYKGVLIKAISDRTVELEYQGDVRIMNTGQTIGN